MTEIHYSRVLDAPIEKVWRIVGDFGSLTQWFPFITKSVIRDGAASTQVGAIRDNTNAEGGVISEELVALSNGRHSMTYRVIAGDIPMKDYHSTLSIHEVTEDRRSFAVWTASYEPVGDAEKTAEWVRNGVFQTCLANLEEVLARG